MPDFNILIAANADDGYEEQEIPAWEGSGFEGINYLANDSSFIWNGGLAWNLDIPKDAVIGTTVIRLVAVDLSSDAHSVVVSIRAEDADNATTAWSNSSRPSQLNTIGQTVTWNLPASWTGTQDSPNISSIIQALVNRAGWNSGNRIRIALITTSSAGGGFCGFRDFAGGSSDAARLIGSYEEPSNGEPIEAEAEEFVEAEDAVTSLSLVFPIPEQVAALNDLAQATLELFAAANDVALISDLSDATINPKANALEFVDISDVASAKLLAKAETLEILQLTDTPSGFVGGILGSEDIVEAGDITIAKLLAKALAVEIVELLDTSDLTGADVARDTSVISDVAIATLRAKASASDTIIMFDSSRRRSPGTGGGGLTGITNITSITNID